MTTKVIICDCCGVKHDFDVKPVSPDWHYRECAAELGWTYAREWDRDFCPGCS